MSQDNNGRNLLHLAAINVDTYTINTILSQFNDLDEMIAYMKTVNNYGKTFIHYLADLSGEVISYFNEDTVEFILQALVDKVDTDTLFEIFNIKDNDNKTALYYSFFNENCTMFGLYLLTMFNSSQRKALLNVKIEIVEKDLVYEELDKKRALLNEEIDDRKDLLQEEIDVEKYLLNEDIYERKEALEDRRDLLDFEIDESKDILQEELDRRKNLLDFEINERKKLLQEELDRRKEILSEEISHRKDLLTLDIIKGKTLFHHLLMHIDEDFVLQIFDSLNRSDLISLMNTLDNEKKSPLHLAAIAKNARVFEAILNLFDNNEDRKRYIKQKDMYGRTALHYVSKHSELPVTPSNIKSAVTKCKISFDPFSRFLCIVDLIEMNLEDEFSGFVNEKDTDGKTALFYAIEDSRYLLTFLSRIDRDEIVDSLDVSVDSVGNKLLHFLAMFSQFSTILTILKYCPTDEVAFLIHSINNEEKSVIDLLKESNIPRENSNELLKLIENPLDKQEIEIELGIL